MTPRRRFLLFLLAFSASPFVLSQPVHAQITVTFSNTVNQSVDPSTAGEIQSTLNAGLKKLAQKKNTAAADLYASKQKIQIICFGDPLAKKLGLKPDPTSKVPDYAQTKGDFLANGKPKPGGTTYIAVNCPKLKKKNWYHWWSWAGVNIRMYNVLVHELLHATNQARRHPPDTFALYDAWVKTFLGEIKRELRKAKNAAGKRRNAARKKKKKATRVGFDWRPSTGGAMAVSYDSKESWEGGTTSLPPPDEPVDQDDDDWLAGGIPISQGGPEVSLALPSGWEGCGSGCQRPGTGGPPTSKEVWCTNQKECTKRGTDCGCHLLRKNRKGPKKLEYVAKPGKKMKADNTKYTYHCHCVHPSSTSAGGAGVADPSGVHVSATEPISQSTPRQAAAEKPRELPSYLTIKATQAAMKRGDKAAVVARAAVKVQVAEPELPVAGNARDENTGAADDPIQGLTQSDGSLDLSLPQQTAAALTVSEVAVDLTPRETSVARIEVEPEREDWAEPESYLHPSVLGYVTRAVLVDGMMLVTLHYPVGKRSHVDGLLGKSENVVKVEPNDCRGKQRGPNDPYFRSKGTWKQPHDDQWAIKRVGLTAERDSAWELMPGKPSPVVVAVIDTGLDWNHKDLAWKNIWKNEDEIAGNGIDDDGNGYVDDVIGWDFFRNHHKPWDYDGHGTFVAGVIVATQGNRVGIAGINPNAKIMVLKALNSFGHTRASYLAEAIVYAAENGADVINLSVGGKDLTDVEQFAIDHAHAEGVVIIVAAGNEGIDVSGFGPAGAENVITVASTDLDDRRVGFSNWGAGIDIAAPGLDVLSLRARRTDLMRDVEGMKYSPGDAYVGKDKRYYRSSGTSMSAPIVAGVASLILSRNPTLDNEDVERMLLHSARDLEVPGVDQYTGYGLVDARAALSADPGYFLEAGISGVDVTKVGGKTLIRVTGTADASGFARAWLEIGAGATPTRWKKVSQEIAARVRDGVLGDIAPDSFQGSKQWVIRLISEDQNGRRREAWFDLELG